MRRGTGGDTEAGMREEKRWKVASIGRKSGLDPWESGVCQMFSSARSVISEIKERMEKGERPGEGGGAMAGAAAEGREWG